jgi:hypothetical protein
LDFWFEIKPSGNPKNHKPVLIHLFKKLGATLERVLGFYHMAELSDFSWPSFS